MNALDVSDVSFASGQREALKRVGVSLAPGRCAARLRFVLPRRGCLSRRSLGARQRLVEAGVGGC